MIAATNLHLLLVFPHPEVNINCTCLFTSNHVISMQCFSRFLAKTKTS